VNKLHIIGIGYRPFDIRAKKLISEAGIILASDRLYEVFKRYEGFEAVKDKVRVLNKINDTIVFIRSTIAGGEGSKPMVLLASGDPLFFGIGRRAIEEFGRENVEVMPDLSCIQLAFAAIGEPWDNAFLLSLHGGPDPEKRRRLPYGLQDLPGLLNKHGKLAILTDRENNPSAIASLLQSSLFSFHSSVTLHVCERLGYPDEKITRGTPAEIARLSFSDPNVVIAIKGAGRPEATAADFGLRESDIVHSRGLITKDEVRAVCLHKLRLPQKGVFWDVGAGSGSVSLEAARSCPELKAYAIEKNAEQLSNIKENVSRFGTANIVIISGEAPDALAALPPPDRVFIGGSAGRMKEIVGLISGIMLKGIIVINATTLETLNEAMESLGENGFEVDIAEIAVSRSKRVGGKQHMSALNPVFVIRGEK